METNEKSSTMSTLTFLYNENFIEACNFIEFQVCFPYFAHCAVGAFMLTSLWGRR